MSSFRAELEERFWNSTDPLDLNGCRLWKQNVSNKHARFSLRVREQELGFHGREVSAHLIAWWFKTGTVEKFVDRTCGNTLCVEPSHLEVRTKATRFWQKVDQSSADGCWLWLAGKHTFGYGSTGEGSAHRIAYELSFGSIPDGKVVRHTCHNPVCCRPDHLLIGTQHDNIQDMIKAGRGQWASGSEAGLAKFTDDRIKSVRSVFKSLVRDGFNQRDALAEIASLTTVTPATIWRIVKEITYK